MGEGDAVVYALKALLDAYPVAHPLHTLAHMATQLAEHPAILVIEVALTPVAHLQVVDLLVYVEPEAYPLLDELMRFGDAVGAATGVEFVGVQRAEWAAEPDGPHLGHRVIFGLVPAWP